MSASAVKSQSHREVSPYWGVVQTKPMKERSVTRLLRERGIESYLPMYRKKAPRKGRPPVLAPFFPCYLFVGFTDEESVHVARWTQGVLRLLGVEHRPHRVPPELIAELRERERGKGYIVLRKRFAPRERVRITSGLLAGFEGIFHQETSDGERIRILLSHLGYQAMVELATEEVEAISTPARKLRQRVRRSRRSG